jgi:hypothetical protein
MGCSGDSSHFNSNKLKLSQSVCDMTMTSCKPFLLRYILGVIAIQVVVNSTLEYEYGTSHPNYTTNNREAQIHLQKINAYFSNYLSPCFRALNSSSKDLSNCSDVCSFIVRNNTLNQDFLFMFKYSFSLASTGLFKMLLKKEIFKSGEVTASSNLRV